MAASIYDPALYEAVHKKYTAKQCRSGGLTRAKKGRRHPVYKVYLKDDGTCTLPATYKHGHAGGVASGKARKAKAQAKHKEKQDGKDS